MGGDDVIDTVRGSNSPAFFVGSDETDEGFDFGGGDVFLEQLAVVVQQRRDGVFRQNVEPDLLLHEGKLLGDIFLKYVGVEWEKKQHN